MRFQIERKDQLGTKEYQVEFRHIHNGNEEGRKRLAVSGLRGITVATVASDGKVSIGVALCGGSEPAFVKETGRVKALALALRRGPFREDAGKLFLAYRTRKWERDVLIEQRIIQAAPAPEIEGANQARAATGPFHFPGGIAELPPE